jgi:hypothetical protein
MDEGDSITSQLRRELRISQQRSKAAAEKLRALHQMGLGFAELVGAAEADDDGDDDEIDGNGDAPDKGDDGLPGDDGYGAENGEGFGLVDATDVSYLVGRVQGFSIDAPPRSASAAGSGGGSDGDGASQTTPPPRVSFKAGTPVAGTAGAAASGDFGGGGGDNRAGRGRDDSVLPYVDGLTGLRYAVAHEFYSGMEYALQVSQGLLGWWRWWWWWWWL